jgi:hypothetical protein
MGDSDDETKPRDSTHQTRNWRISRIRYGDARQHTTGGRTGGRGAQRTLPPDYKNWRLITSSHRHDNNTLRVILGNGTAIDAARTGNTNPWPEGTILCKLVWKDAIHEHWEKAVIPGEFVHAEFMIKDSGKYRETAGWGFARWLGMDQQAYGTDAAFAQECFGCHIPVKGNDYVFTHPAKLP